MATKCTEARVDRIVEAVSKGHYLKTVCMANGVHSETLRKWMRDGRLGKAPYALFRERVLQAQAQAEIDMGDASLKGDARGEGNGKAKCAQWMLERTRSEHFSPTMTAKIKGVSDMFLDVCELTLPSDMVDKIYAALAETNGEGIPMCIVERDEAAEDAKLGLV